MTDQELRDEVRRLRARGMPPRDIARALDVRRALIVPIVRQLAAETPPRPPEHGELVGCWISPAWSRDLLVRRDESAQSLGRQRRIRGRGVSRSRFARLHGTVVGLDDHAATVRLERPVGRFAGGRVRCPPLTLEKLAPAG